MSTNYLKQNKIRYTSMKKYDSVNIQEMTLSA